jgi:hypothetical protein
VERAWVPNLCDHARAEEIIDEKPVEVEERGT